MSMDMDSAIAAFLAEARELLENMEDAFLKLEAAPDDEDAINEVFRAAHTIKGTAGIFGYDDVVSFTHVVESVLENLRAGKLRISEDLTAVLLECRDHMGLLVEAAVNEDVVSSGEKTVGDNLLNQLKVYLGDKSAPKTEQKAEPQANAQPKAETKPARDKKPGVWHIGLNFSEDVLRSGMDPISFIRYLKKMGDVKRVDVDDSALPSADVMDPESCYLNMNVVFESATADRDSIEKVFEFVKQDCELSILPPVDQVWDYLAAIDSLPDEVKSLGEMLKESGVLSQSELLDALEHQNSLRSSGTQDESAMLGSILVSQGKVREEVVKAALEKQDKSKRVSGPRQLRVDADKLDQLINLVGELVISGATANLLAQKTNDNTLLESVSSMSHLVEEIRDSALRLRMVQIGETFGRFQRVVRDVSRELGKDIHLEISGGETELDKTMVEKISDPLMHLVRNAMDHGLEMATDRIKAGKDGQGTLHLNAYHDSGSIVIQVIDDGRGLNKGKIFAKAVEKGIINADSNISEQDIYRLIFEPGFSTAEQVTNLSGRGVGMDVVKKNIEGLRGTVDVDSAPGEGTSINIRLPLTLAIIDGFLVDVCGSTYVIPLDMVVECIELDEEDDNLSVHNNYINLRDRVLPFLKLRDLFNEEGRKPVRESIVVVQNGSDTAGLVVDELLGEFQTVIKPLGKIFQNLKGASGATILGTGEVAVILDVPGLINKAVTKAEGLHVAVRDQGSVARQMTLH